MEAALPLISDFLFVGSGVGGAGRGLYKGKKSRIYGTFGLACVAGDFLDQYLLGDRNPVKLGLSFLYDSMATRSGLVAYYNFGDKERGDRIWKRVIAGTAFAAAAGITTTIQLHLNHHLDLKDALDPATVAKDVNWSGLGIVAAAFTCATDATDNEYVRKAFLVIAGLLQADVGYELNNHAILAKNFFDVGFAGYALIDDLLGQKPTRWIKSQIKSEKIQTVLRFVPTAGPLKRGAAAVANRSLDFTRFVCSGFLGMARVAAISATVSMEYPERKAVRPNTIKNPAGYYSGLTSATTGLAVSRVAALGE